MSRVIPTVFEAVPQTEYKQITPLITKGRVSIFYKGKNRNRGYITDEFAEKLIQTLPYVPVVGIFDTGKDDFTSHSRNRDVARMYGLVPENPNGEWLTKIDEDGLERTYFVCDVYLYTGRFTNANKIIGNPQSLELDIHSIKGNWADFGGEEYFVYDDAYFIGLSALGKDVEPCFEGAAFFELLTQFGEFLTNAELSKNNTNNLGGNKSMNLNDFKFTSDPVKESIWRALNPNFSEENNWKIDNVVCEVSKNYSIAYNPEEKTYKQYNFSVSEDNNVVLEEPIVLFANWLDQEEFANYNSLKEEYTNFKNIVDSFENLKQIISEKDSKILELEQAKTTYELEVNNANEEKNQIQEDFNKLQNDYNVLKEEHDNRILEAKEQKIGEYESLISDSALTQIREKIADYTIEDLEKELLFIVKKEKPAMFSKETTNNYAFTGYTGDETVSGIVSILEKYRNK